MANTVGYFERILGFKQQWIWGDPPVCAGVRAGDALLYICLDPELAGAIQKRQLTPDIYVWVADIQSLYEQHRQGGAEIVEDLQIKPWGTRQYTIREPNGYRLKLAEIENTESRPELP